MVDPDNPIQNRGDKLSFATILKALRKISYESFITIICRNPVDHRERNFVEELVKDLYEERVISLVKDGSCITIIYLGDKPLDTLECPRDFKQRLKELREDLGIIDDALAQTELELSEPAPGNNPPYIPG